VKAIIIGAGCGQRMLPLTQDFPKCMMEGLGDRKVLDWIIDSINYASIDDIVFVGGYKIDKIITAYSKLRFYNNIEWLNNNVLESLFYAKDEMNGELIISYSDIIYRRNIIKRMLLNKEADIVLVIDQNWSKRYKNREGKKPIEAEKVIVENGRIVKIGKKLSLEKVYGEFIGLAWFSESATDKMCERYNQLYEKHITSAFHEAANIRQAYLTDMIQELINEGMQVKSFDIWTEWAELDTPEDLNLARHQLSKYGEEGLTKEFWAMRAEGYDNLDWVSRQPYLKKFINAGDYLLTDNVLDVGCGTGKVLQAIAPYVKKIVGLDSSSEMLDHAKKLSLTNCTFIEGFAEKLVFPNNSFDKITARMIFHHLIERGQQAMKECYRVLKQGGKMVFSEGIPPHPSLYEWYSKMFAYKEERLTFLEEDLVNLMKSGGFIIEKIIKHKSPQVSIGNWLKQSGLPAKKQNQIMQMHLDLDETGKQYYNMRVLENDVLCDFIFIILVGSKKTQ